MKGTPNVRGVLPAVQTPPTAAEDPGRQFVVALARGLSLLRLFTSPDSEYGNQELAQLTQLTKPTVSRLTFTLTCLGYLHCDATTGRYRLGTAALSLGYWAMSSAFIRTVANPIMQALSDEMNVCCALGYQDGLEAVYLEHTRGATPLFLGMQPGSRTPLATTAIGRCLVAVMEETAKAKFYADAARHYGNGWKSYEPALKQAMLDLKKRGFVVSTGEWEPAIAATSVPLHLGPGQRAMALVAGGAAYLLEQDGKLDMLGPRLRSLADQIRLELDRTRTP